MIDHLLNRQLAIYRNANPQDDGFGGQSNTMEYIRTENFRVAEPVNINEVPQAGTYQGDTLNQQLYGTFDSAVRRGDELRGTDPGTGQNQTFRVIGIMTPSLPAYVKVYAELYQFEGQ